MHRFGVVLLCWLVALSFVSQVSAGVIAKTDKAGDVNATGLTATSTNDTLTCSGGTIMPGQQLQLNVRMTPGPTTGMGGQLFGRQDGVFKGPLQITGP